MGMFTITSQVSQNRKDSVLSVDRFKIRKYPSQDGFQEHLLISDLSPSIRLLYFLGIFPRDKISTKNVSHVRNLMSKLFGILLCTWWCYAVTVSTLSVTRIVKNLRTNFTINFMNILIAFKILVMYRKRHQILSTIRFIEKFHVSVADNSYRSIKKTLTIMAVACFVATIFQMVVSIEYLKAAGFLEDYSNDFQLGLNVTLEKAIFFRIYPKIVFTVTVFYHHFTPMALCIFICSIYFTFKRSIEEFRNRIKRETLKSSMDIDWCASSFNGMADTMLTVEDLLSSVTLLLYGILMANQLCVITHCIIGGKIISHPMSIMMEVVVTIKNLTVFFSLTLTGSSVADSMQGVAYEIKRLTAESRRDFEKVSLLMQNASSSCFSLTAWRMFSLKRSLILTTASVMLSYAMLLMQFAQQKKD